MRPKAATFDCYGTLVDWEGGIGAFLYALMLREGVEEPPPGRELRTRWEEIQFELVRGPYKPYKEILGEATMAWCREHCLPENKAYADAIVGSMRAWQPFPDTRPALTAVRDAGVRLVILSNTDRDIITHSVKQIGVEFDQVIVAEDVGSYKPSCTWRSGSSTTSGPRSSSVSGPPGSTATRSRCPTQARCPTMSGRTCGGSRS